MVGSSVAEDGVMHFGQWIDDLHTWCFLADPTP